MFFASYVEPKTDALLGEVPVIPDHKLYFVPCASAEEAFYLCGFLNSPAVRAFVTGYVVDTQIATHVTEYIDIPSFDSTNSLHQTLSQITSAISLNRREATTEERVGIEKIVEQLFS